MEEQVQEDQIPQEIINEAIRTGWQPLEQFPGNKEKWRPADEWVQRGKEYIPFIKAELTETKSELNQYKTKQSELESQLKKQSETMKMMVEMSSKVGQQAYERAKKDIQAKQAQAVADGNVEAWQRLEDQKDKLTPPEEIKIEETPTQTESPIFTQWKSTNSWYGQDQDVSLFADSYGETLKRQNPTMAYQEILQAVETKVKDVFPHKFENFNRQQETAVDTSTQRTQTSQVGKKTYNNLPADAKAQCDAFIRDGVIKDRQQYVNDFFGLEDEMKARREQLLGG